MKKITLALRVFNLLVIGSAAALAATIHPPKALSDVRAPLSVALVTLGEVRRDYTLIKEMANPMHVICGIRSCPMMTLPRLLGTDSIAGDASSAAAYLELGNRRFNAYIGETSDELDGWTLVEIGPRTAHFKKGSRVEVIHQVD